jgi:hypothetical protein
MSRRGYKHQSPLDIRLASGEADQREFVDSPETQKKILRKKKCGCRV